MSLCEDLGAEVDQAVRQTCCQPIAVSAPYKRCQNRFSYAEIALQMSEVRCIDALRSARCGVVVFQPYTIRSPLGKSISIVFSEAMIRKLRQDRPQHQRYI